MRGPVINALFLGLVLVTAVLLAALLVLGPRPSPPQAPVLTRGACAPCPACPTSPAALASPTADVRWLLVQRWLPSHGEALTVCASGADVFTGAPQPPSLSATQCHVTFVASVDQLGAGLERTRLGGLIVLLAPAGDKDWPWSNAVDEGRVEVLETLAGATPMRVGKRAEAIDNFALAAWKADKKRGDYEDLRRDASRRTVRECYALMVALPVDEMFHDLFLTAVHRLRLLDPTRDVVVYFIPRDGDKSGPLWAPKYARLGAHVLFRDPLPLRPFDRNFYYQFDYQKLYIWNLPYWRVMFLDGDVIVQQSPALAWNLCYHRPDRPLCAVQEVGKWGGYMNPNAPWRQICLQDVMNEVYDHRWQPLPEAFNHQGLKRDVWTETEHAKVVHFKECAEVGAGRFKSCEFYLTYRAAMRAALANESRIA